MGYEPDIELNWNWIILRWIFFISGRYCELQTAIYACMLQ